MLMSAGNLSTLKVLQVEDNQVARTERLTIILQSDKTSIRI